MFVLPIHFFMFVMMGMHLIENADLDALSEACGRNKRYEFQFVMAPLILMRGTASTVKQLALF
jgi:hypothetical protein